VTYSALIVEDDSSAVLIVRDMLKDIGFTEFSIASTLEEGKALLPGTWPLAVIDERLPDGSGIELAALLRAARPDIVIVVSTVVDDQSAIRQAFAVPVNYFVVKPNGLKRLMTSRSDPNLLLDMTAREIIKGR